MNELIGKTSKMQDCCKNCRYLMVGYASPKGNRFHDEFRCLLFSFIFWYPDNLDGIEELCCRKYRSNQEPQKKTFICPWCDRKLPISVRCSKGYCRSCAGKDHIGLI